MAFVGTSILIEPGLNVNSFVKCCYVVPSGAVGLSGGLFSDNSEDTGVVLTDVNCVGTEQKLEECAYNREVVGCDTNAAVVCQGNPYGLLVTLALLCSCEHLDM